MSETQRIPQASGPGDGSGGGVPLGLRIGIAAAVAVLLALLVVLVVARGGDDPTVAPSPTPTEEPTDEPTDEPTEEPTDPAEPDDEEASPEPTDGEREPTDADAAAFADGYRPERAQGLRSVAADLNDDGRNEVVFAAIVDDGARIDVAAWDGTGYEIVYIGRGGGAERLDDLRVADFTGDGNREIVTLQSVGAQGQSLSIWGWTGEGYAPQRAQGGCWDGRHTYGVIGAGIERGRIVASCDGSPLPTSAWPSDVYTWDGRAWTYDRTRR